MPIIIANTEYFMLILGSVLPSDIKSIKQYGSVEVVSKIGTLAYV